MAKRRPFGHHVQVGPNAKIGRYVILGHPSSKSRDLGPLVIGRSPVIRSHSVLYFGSKIGDNFQTGHGALIRENNVIGNDVSVGSLSEISRDVCIGDGVRIHSRCFVAEFVEIGDRSWIGPGVTILNVPHPPCPSWEQCASGENRVVIGARAKIGGGAVIGPWTKIGARSLVGAGSVVIRDVPAGVVVAGNPARVIRKVRELECDLGLYQTPYEWEVRE